MDVSNDGVGIHSKLGLEKEKSAATKQRVHRTHIENNEDPVEVRLPTGNRILVVPRMKESRDSMSPALFDNLILHFRDSPAADSIVSEKVRSAHWRFNPRQQLAYRIAHRLAEVVEFLSIHSPIKGLTDTGTEQSELDVILFVDHRILVMCESGTSRRKREGNIP